MTMWGGDILVGEPLTKAKVHAEGRHAYDAGSNPVAPCQSSAWPAITFPLPSDPATLY
jgi:hypothetical protein